MQRPSSLTPSPVTDRQPQSERPSGRRHRVLAMLVGLTVATTSMGACSGSDNKTGDNNSTTTTVASSTTTDPGTSSTTPDTLDPELEATMRAAMDRAEAANLVIDDFPAGWQHLPPAEGDVGPLETCTSVDLDTHLMGLYRSDSFSTTVDPGTLKISSSATVLDNVEAAGEVMDDMATDRFVDCVNDLFVQTTDTLEITGGLAVNGTAPDLGDQAVALSGDFTVSPLDDSPDHPLAMAVVAVRTGDMISVISASAVDRNIDEPLLRELLDVLVERQKP